MTHCRVVVTYWDTETERSRLSNETGLPAARLSSNGAETKRNICDGDGRKHS